LTFFLSGRRNHPKQWQGISCGLKCYKDATPRNYHQLFWVRSKKLMMGSRHTRLKVPRG
jgi:hypothetical protein